MSVKDDNMCHLWHSITWKMWLFFLSESHSIHFTILKWRGVSAEIFSHSYLHLVQNNQRAIDSRHCFIGWTWGKYDEFNSSVNSVCWWLLNHWSICLPSKNVSTKITNQSRKTTNTTHHNISSRSIRELQSADIFTPPRPTHCHAAQNYRRLHDIAQKATDILKRLRL